MDISAHSGLRLAVFTAEPGTRSAEGLDLLASWVAKPEALTPADGTSTAEAGIDDFEPAQARSAAVRA